MRLLFERPARSICVMWDLDSEEDEEEEWTIKRTPQLLLPNVRPPHLRKIWAVSNWLQIGPPSDRISDRI